MLLLTLLSLIDTLVQLFQGSLFAITSRPLIFTLLFVVATLATYVVALLWFFEGKEGSPGAGDNLIASSVGIELASYFSSERKNGNPLEHTRIVFASFDGEEAGLRGKSSLFPNALFQVVHWENLPFQC